LITDIIVLPARALECCETTFTPLFAPPEARSPFARLKVLCIHIASNQAGAGVGGGGGGEGEGEESDRWVRWVEKMAAGGGEGGGVVVQILSGLVSGSYRCSSVTRNDVTHPLARPTPTNSRRIFLDTPPEKGSLEPTLLPGWPGGGEEGRGWGGASVGGGCEGEEEGILGSEGKVSVDVALDTKLCCEWEEGGGMHGGRGGEEGEGEGGKAPHSRPAFPLSREMPARGELFVRVCLSVGRGGGRGLRGERLRASVVPCTWRNSSWFLLRKAFKLEVKSCDALDRVLWVDVPLY
jgi:hypothetical protein